MARLRGGRAAGLAGSLLTLGATGLYVAILRSQGDTSLAESAPWVAGFAAVGLGGLAASFARSARTRSRVYAVCAGVTLVVGVLAIFSIGVLLLVAGGLFATAARHARRAG